MTVANAFGPNRCCCCLVWHDYFNRATSAVGTRYKEYEVGSLGSTLGSEAGGSVWSINSGKAETTTTGQSIAINPAKLILPFAHEWNFDIETDGVAVVEYRDIRWAFDAPNSQIRYYWDNHIGSGGFGADDAGIEKRRDTLSGMPCNVSIVNQPPSAIRATSSLYVDGDPVMACWPAANHLASFPRLYLESGSFLTLDNLRVWEHGQHYNASGSTASKKTCPSNLSCSWFPVGDHDEITVVVSGSSDKPGTGCTTCGNNNGTFVLQRMSSTTLGLCAGSYGYYFGGSTPGCLYMLQGTFACGMTKMWVGFNHLLSPGANPYVAIWYTDNDCTDIENNYQEPYGSVIQDPGTYYNFKMFQTGSYIDYALNVGNTLGPFTFSYPFYTCNPGTFTINV